MQGRVDQNAGTGRPKCRDSSFYGPVNMQGRELLRTDGYAGMGVVTDRWTCRDGSAAMQGWRPLRVDGHAGTGRPKCMGGGFRADEHVGTAFLSLFLPMNT